MPNNGRMMAGETLRIGLLGFGEAGYELAKGLKEAGAGTLAVCGRKGSGRAAINGARAAEIGAAYLAGIEEVVAGSDLVLSVVTPAGAEDVAKVAAASMRPGKMYFDLTSSTPAAMQRAKCSIEAAGGVFVDGAIMASVPVYRHKVLIYASGAAAEPLSLQLNRYGMNIRVVGERPGDASAVKLLVSVVSKGLEALLVEMLLAAHRYKAEEQVLAAFGEFLKMGPALLVDRFVGSDAIHAARRAEEMEGAIELYGELGIEPIMSAATIRRLIWSASLDLKRHFGDTHPKSYKDVIDAWEQIGLFPVDK
jgi:3-hydroxyisobutyrate dehydrogenase-like beta-hydroxyacid dehydrogenase